MRVETDPAAQLSRGHGGGAVRAPSLRHADHRLDARDRGARPRPRARLLPALLHARERDPGRRRRRRRRTRCARLADDTYGRVAPFGERPVAAPAARARSARRPPHRGRRPEGRAADPAAPLPAPSSRTAQAARFACARAPRRGARRRPDLLSLPQARAGARRRGECRRLVHGLADRRHALLDLRRAGQGVSLEALEEAVDAAVADHPGRGLDADAVERAKTRLVAETIYSTDSQSSLARIYGSALAIGETIEDVRRWPDEIEAVTTPRSPSVTERFLVAAPFGRPAICARPHAVSTRAGLDASAAVMTPSSASPAQRSAGSLSPGGVEAWHVAVGPRAARRARLHLRGRRGAGSARQGRRRADAGAPSRRGRRRLLLGRLPGAPRGAGDRAQLQRRSGRRRRLAEDARQARRRGLRRSCASRSPRRASTRTRSSACAPRPSPGCATSRTIPASWPRAASSPRRFRATPTAIRRAARSRASPRSPARTSATCTRRVIADGRDEDRRRRRDRSPSASPALLDGVFGALPARRCRGAGAGRPRSPAAARATSSTRRAAIGDPLRHRRAVLARSGLHRRLCAQPHPRRRRLHLAAVPGGAREARPRLLGRHLARELPRRLDDLGLHRDQERARAPNASPSSRPRSLRLKTEGPTDEELAQGEGLPHRLLRARLRHLDQDRPPARAGRLRGPRHRLHRPPQRARRRGDAGRHRAAPPSAPSATASCWWWWRDGPSGL